MPSMPGSVTPPSSNVYVDSTTNHRYSSDSTTSASSSGNWSNRESLDPMQNQSYKHGFYHAGGSNAALTSPTPPPYQPVNGSSPYGIPENRPFPQAPADHYHGNLVGSPPRVMAGSPHHASSPTGSHEQVYNPMSPQHTMSPRRLHPDIGRTLENGIWMRRGGGGGKMSMENSGEESGVDTYGGIPTPGNVPTIHMNVSSKPLGQSQPFHSFENVLGDRDNYRMLSGNQRPHSDSSSDMKMDIMAHPDVKPHYQGKDADRIYEWLRRQRMPEYTNNFTKAGYDMPTISRMTPEDLTAIGVTKPGHRKRISAMISQLSEPDGIPTYRPADVVTWLKLLDLYQYYNTFVSNSYNTMDAVSEITWEDLQEIGINQLGHQKKFSLAIKRLRDLQKQATRHMATAQQAGSAGSDNDSTSPHSSNDGAVIYHHQPQPPLQLQQLQQLPLPPQQQQHPNTLMLSQLAQRTSPLQSPDNTLVKKRSGLRSSQESLGSDGSNKSSGSHGSHEPPGYPKKIVHMKQLSESREASYVPTNLKLAAANPPEQHRGPSPETEGAQLSALQTFSTFRQPPAAPTSGAMKNPPAAGRDRKSNDSLERGLASQASDSSPATSKRNSVEGSSSISSSGSGDGSVKMKRSNPPPAPPKRTNSIRTSEEEQLRTATIGRKKSLKQFREEMASVGTAATKKVELPEGYATIKRSASRKTPVFARSASQEGDHPSLAAGIAIGAPVPPTVPVLPPADAASLAGVEATAAGQPMDATDETQPPPHTSVNYSAYGVTNQPVVASAAVQQQAGQNSVTSTPARSASVPTSPVNMPRPSWTGQPTTAAGSRDAGRTQEGPASTSSTPSHHPVISKSSAALIAEMQQSITASMHPSARLAPQTSVRVESATTAAAAVSTNGASQTGIAAGQMPAAKTDEVAAAVAVLHRQSSGAIGAPLGATDASTKPGGTFKVPQGLPPRSGSRPSSSELLQTTGRRPSSGGFKLGVDIELEKQNQMQRMQQGVDVSMRDGLQGTVQRPPSTGSTGSGGSDGSGSNRPSNMELLWKRMSQEGEESAPIIQPALAKPLEGIWRPKSRHYDIGGPGEDQLQQEEPAMDGDTSTLRLQTKATFRSLKKQFLDQNATPITYHTLKRPAKKPDPNIFDEEFRPRSKSFTDMDEYHQSPVAKDAPIDFETFVAQEEAALDQPDFDGPASEQPRTYPSGNGSPQQTRTHGTPVKLPFPDNGVQKPVSLPGLVSNNHGAQSGNASPVDGSQDLGMTASIGGYVPEKTSPPQIPPLSMPPPQSLPVYVPPPPQVPPPEVPRHKPPSPEEPVVRPSPKKLALQQVLPPKVSPKAPRAKAPPPLLPTPPPPLEQPPDLLPPPPPAEDFPPPPPPPSEDLPLPPPPAQDFDLPPPPQDDASLPPPPPAPTSNPPFSLLSSYGFPAPPPSAQLASQKSSKPGGPLTAPKKKKASQRTPVVSEGWESNSDTIKRKPSTPSPVLSLPPDPSLESLSLDPEPPKESRPSPSVAEKKRKSPVKAPVSLPEKSGKPTVRSGKAPVKAPVKKKPVVAPPPLEDSDDVDFYSQDLDRMDTLGGQEDALGSESDNSDMESALTGFENENTDTIKKQPMKLSPARTRTEVNSMDLLNQSLNSGPADSLDASNIIRRNREDRSTSKKDRDSQGFGEVSLQLADILNSMGSNDPLADFAASAEASAMARKSPTKAPPSQPPPTDSLEQADSKDIFNDIESMFNDLTFDLETMMN